MRISTIEPSMTHKTVMNRKARAFTLITGSQFLMAALIDHFGLFGAAVRPVDASRALGLVVMMAGVWLVVR